MLRKIAWPQFLRWYEFDTVEPIGGRRGDWQAASICAAVSNVMMAVHGHKRRFRTADFMLEFSGKDKQVAEDGGSETSGQTWQQMKFIAMQQVALANAEVARRKR